ncbi:uncharacterized protein [Dermacentor albipictus]|uniref:uncharacterized protein isoform X2 n=1 Tax=Dermacentor albipictus TaxID=60249 RepID=UPI0038FD3892
MALQDAGCSLSLHWRPAHVGIPGNEEADTLAKSAHDSSAPLNPAVTAADFSRNKLRRHIIACHPDKRVSLGRPPRPPTNGCLVAALSASWLLLDGSPPAPPWESQFASLCPPAETLEHLLLACPAHLQHRGRLLQEFHRLGLPCSLQEDILFSCRNQEDVEDGQPLPASTAGWRLVSRICCPHISKHGSRTRPLFLVNKTQELL